MLNVVLDSATGGGFTKWNCNTDLGRSTRYIKPLTQTRTQFSIAASAGGEVTLTKAVAETVKVAS